jgi:hypothetical protein
MGTSNWQLGDRVIHSGRPEWGVGEVRAAEAVQQNGARSQRLTIRFERAGVKVLSTEFAELRPAGDLQSVPAAEAPEVDDRESLAQRLAELPGDATDPFRTRKARMEATLGLYRFAGGGAALLDWAAAQTGLKDPLSSFSRHELEGFFDRFRMNLDGHLRKLSYELKKEDPAALAVLAAKATPEARQALKRADGGR